MKRKLTSENVILDADSFQERKRYFSVMTFRSKGLITAVVYAQEKWILDNGDNRKFMSICLTAEFLEHPWSNQNRKIRQILSQNYKFLFQQKHVTLEVSWKVKIADKCFALLCKVKHRW